MKEVRDPGCGGAVGLRVGELLTLTATSLQKLVDTDLSNIKNPFVKILRSIGVGTDVQS